MSIDPRRIDPKEWSSRELKKSTLKNQLVKVVLFTKQKTSLDLLSLFKCRDFNMIMYGEIAGNFVCFGTIKIPQIPEGKIQGNVKILEGIEVFENLCGRGSLISRLMKIEKTFREHLNDPSTDVNAFPYERQKKPRLIELLENEYAEMKKKNKKKIEYHFEKHPDLILHIVE